MNKERLLQLAELLEADADNAEGIKFDMGTFGVIRDEDKPLSCGTSACAMGLAGLSGAFFKDGLTARWSRAGGMDFYWKDDGKVGAFWAAQQLFEIDHHDARRLFSGREPWAMHGAEDERLKALQLRKFVELGYVPMFDVDRMLYHPTQLFGEAVA